MTRSFRFSPEENSPIVSALVTGAKATRRIRLIFDTGAAMTQIHTATMAKIGILSSDKVSRAVAIGVGGKASEGYIAEVRKFFVLGAKIENIKIAAFTMDYLDEEGIDGLLGWDIIRNFHLEMNGPEGLLKIFS